MKEAICLAMFGSILLIPNLSAEDLETKAIRSVIDKAAENWSAMKIDANDAFYTSDADAVWFDIAPTRYQGWSAYKEGAKKLFATFESISYKPLEDLRIQRRGNVAWVTFTFSNEIHMRDGKVEKAVGRATDILEKRNGKWMIVHEHVSFPAPM